MKIYKRRGCLPSRFISKTKVEAPRGKEVATDPFRSIHASKNGKKAVPGWPMQGNRTRDCTEVAWRSHGGHTEIVRRSRRDRRRLYRKSYSKLTERKHAENPQRELPKRSGGGSFTAATHNSAPQ